MLPLGLVLIGLGVLVVALGIATIDDAGGATSMLGFDLGSTTIFLVGVGCGVAAILGLWLVKIGTQQGLRRRRQVKQQVKQQPGQQPPHTGGSDDSTAPETPGTGLTEIDPGPEKRAE